MSTFIVPSGYRFGPSDQELVCPYLLNKVIGKPLPCNGVVKEFDLYSTEDPRELFEGTKEKIVYCYTLLKKRNKNSSRFVRMVGNCTWKGQDKGKPVYDNKGHHIGCKRSFTYLTKSRAKGGYSMQEYSLDGDYQHYLESHDCYVLCRIKKKNSQKIFGVKAKLPQPERVIVSERMPIDVHENWYWKNRVNNVGLEAADSEGFFTNESTTIGAEGVQQQLSDGIPNENQNNTAIELASAVPSDCTLSVTSAAGAAPLPRLERGGSVGMPIDIVDDDDDLMIPTEDDESWCTNSCVGLEAAVSAGFPTNESTTIGCQLNHEQVLCVPQDDEYCRKEHDSPPWDTTVGAAGEQMHNQNIAIGLASPPLPTGLEWEILDDATALDVHDDDLVPVQTTVMTDNEDWCTNSFLGLEAADERTIGSFIDHDQMMMMGVVEEDEHRKEHGSQDTTTGAAAAAGEEQSNRIIYNRNMAIESPASAPLPSWGLEFDVFDCTAPVASAASFAAMEEIDAIPYTTSGLGNIPFTESSLATMGDEDEFDSHLQLGSYDLWGLW